MTPVIQSCIVALLLATPIAILTPVARGQVAAKLTLTDRSIIRCTAIGESLPIDTAYGPLAIPFAEIAKIKFGLHWTPSEAKELLDAKRQLRSNVFKERELGKRTFSALGKLSMPMLLDAAKTPDPDTAKSASLLMQSITDADPLAAGVAEFDTVTTTKFPVVGRINLEKIAFRSPTLGDFSVQLGRIDTLEIRGHGEMTLMVPTNKTGSDGVWIVSGVVIEKGDTITIKARGSVDLWPQAPGQYIATPSGYSVAGKGGQFAAGSLIGKIGGGQPFLIGDVANIAAKDAGELALQVYPSPWNAPAAGGYEVEVKVR